MKTLVLTHIETILPVFLKSKKFFQKIFFITLLGSINLIKLMSSLIEFYLSVVQISYVLLQ